MRLASGTVGVLLFVGAVEVLMGSSARLFAETPGAAATDMRIVACDAPVQSRKRGVCANRLEAEDFQAFAPGVSWWYNWHFQLSQTPPDGISFDYLPMVWGDDPASLTGFNDYLETHPKPRAVLILNEPNLKDQAFIPPKRTAEVYQLAKAIADRFGVPVVGPHMSLGSATEASITAMDPIENKEVTYTYMVPFLKAFLHFAGDTNVPAIGYHAYGDINELRWSVGEMHKQFDRPIWVTEYAWWGAPDTDAAVTYLMQATDLLERTPHVRGYAWFKERSDNEIISLLAEAPGALSALGRAYVAMPVHDDDLYYRIPGRLQAERYVTMRGAEIYPTRDVDGLADMTTTEDRGYLTYNIHVDAPGTYTVTLRTRGGAGPIQIAQGGHVRATLAPGQVDGWEDLTARFKLPAGMQTLRITCVTKDTSLNWIGFIGPE